MWVSRQHQTLSIQSTPRPRQSHFGSPRYGGAVRESADRSAKPGVDAMRPNYELICLSGGNSQINAASRAAITRG